MLGVYLKQTSLKLSNNNEMATKKKQKTSKEKMFKEDILQQASPSQ